MSAFVKSCKKNFGKTNLYEILDVKRDALERDIKKAYYKLSLKVHPDRVPESEKVVAKEKFQTLYKVYEILTDEQKRKVYDETGVIDENFDGSETWLELWKKIFTPITIKDIENYKEHFQNSELERADIKKAYMNGKGCIDYIHEHVPFLGENDEERLKTIVQEMIDANEVPEFQIFTNEPESKRKRRFKRYTREKASAKKYEEKMKDDEKRLEQEIMCRRQDREANFTSFLDGLARKYGQGDEEENEEDSDFGEAPPRKKSKVNKKKNEKTTTPKAKPKERAVRNGRVSRRK